MKLFKIWNDNFEKGLSIFQLCLMGVMIIGAIINNKVLIMFSMFNILFAYFEPNTSRFSIDDIKLNFKCKRIE